MRKTHPKRRFLEEMGALHRRPQDVRAELFERDRFFDALDKVQVKYEMLRAHAVDRETVVAAAEAYGFSRETFYAALRAFERRGMLGLVDGKAGRPGPLKMTEEALRWIEEIHRDEPELTGRDVAERLAAALGVEVHRRTIERWLRGKKNG
jgi:transposase